MKKKYLSHTHTKPTARQTHKSLISPTLSSTDVINTTLHDYLTALMYPEPSLINLVILHYLV